jgi:hypothetical protein
LKGPGTTDMNNVHDSRARTPVTGSHALLDADITAAPSHGGIVLVITRKRPRRIWMGLDEIPLVIAALQAHLAPMEVRQVEGRQR